MLQRAKIFQRDLYAIQPAREPAARPGRRQAVVRKVLFHLGFIADIQVIREIKETAAKWLSTGTAAAERRLCGGYGGATGAAEKAMCRAMARAAHWL